MTISIFLSAERVSMSIVGKQLANQLTFVVECCWLQILYWKNYYFLLGENPDIGAPFPALVSFCP
jgi:hypothetical protein